MLTPINHYQHVMTHDWSSKFYAIQERPSRSNEYISKSFNLDSLPCYHKRPAHLIDTTGYQHCSRPGNGRIITMVTRELNTLRWSDSKWATTWTKRPWPWSYWHDFGEARLRTHERRHGYCNWPIKKWRWPSGRVGSLWNGIIYLYKYLLILTESI